MNNNFNLLLISLALALLPFLVVIGTAYLKINIVLNLFKNAIGAQQVPSGIIIGILSLAISLMVMEPVWDQTSSYLQSSDLLNTKLEKLSLSELINKSALITQPWKEFISQHAGEEELHFLASLLAKSQRETDETKNNFATTLTAFLLSELKEAFQMGLMVLLPFLIIDFLIANLLAGLGMMMFSPVLLSLPLKIILIVGLDFWQLIIKSLILSYD